jgi:hypothetical protein
MGESVRKYGVFFEGRTRAGKPELRGVAKAHRNFWAGAERGSGRADVAGGWAPSPPTPLPHGGRGEDFSFQLGVVCEGVRDERARAGKPELRGVGEVGWGVSGN